MMTRSISFGRDTDDFDRAVGSRSQAFRFFAFP